MQNQIKNSDNMDVAREYPDYRFHVTEQYYLYFWQENAGFTCL